METSPLKLEELIKGKWQLLISATIAMVICALLGCGTPTSKMMQPSKQISASPDYALVTFMRPTRGTSVVDPIEMMDDSGYLIWENENYVGELQPKKYIQYKTATGEHIFIIEDQNIGAIKAHLLAGKSYYVNVTQGLMPIRPIVDVLRPDDPRIDQWLANLAPMTLDPVRWEAQKSICNFPTRRPISPEVCQVLIKAHKGEVTTVREGFCVPKVLLGPAEAYCEATVMNPEDGR